jgi:pimeloyl-ACP methyl ester carboxylesterase
VNSFNLPGFGVSSVISDENIKKAKRFTKEEIINYYCEILQKYISHYFPNKKIVLMGHSFGGFLCIQFASRYPDLINKLIVIDCGGCFLYKVYMGVIGDYFSKHVFHNYHYTYQKRQDYITYFIC